MPKANNKMNLIFIYGPSAVGKLTVAKELSKITGYKVFHNHLTVDLVESIFDFGTEKFSNLVGKYRLELIEAAAKAGVNLIFTFVYAKSHDDKFIKGVAKAVEKYRGEIKFVQLYSSKTKLAKRLKHPSRKRFNKMRRLKNLNELMDKHDIISAVPSASNFRIDNTNLAPKHVAQMIKAHFRLKK